MTDTIHHAMQRVMKRTGYVYKDDKIQLGGGSGYTVTSETAVLKAIRPVLVDEEINIYPETRELIIEGSRAFVVMDFTFHHVPSGTSIKVSTAGAGMDKGDKMVGKATTNASKYALLKVTVSVTGDDPDKERPEEQPAGTRGSEVQDAAADHAAHERHTLVNEFNAEYKRIGTPLAKAAIKAHFQGSQWDTSKVHIDTLKKVVAAMNDTVVAPGGTE